MAAYPSVDLPHELPIPARVERQPKRRPQPRPGESDPGLQQAAMILVRLARGDVEKCTAGALLALMGICSVRALLWQER